MIPQHHYVSCVGCGTRVHAYDSTTFSCPNRDCLPEVNHVLQRKHVLNQDLWLRGKIEDSRNPFVRYRHRLLSYHRCMNSQLSDTEYLQHLELLDKRLVEVDGRSFEETPARLERDLARSIGLGVNQQLMVKDETCNVGDSHKARHLFGILLNLGEEERKREFAIASCGNAALAAAVIAKSAGCKLKVFIPEDAEVSVVEKLKKLGAELEISLRQEGVSGDPCYVAFREAVRGGSLPFSCQGPDNGLTIEGGHTLCYELFDQWERERFLCNHLVIQVGGGALASSSALALADVMRFDPLVVLPRLHTVQTRGAFPLARAYDRMVKMIMARLRGEADPVLERCVDDMSVEERAARHDVGSLELLLNEADCIRAAWDSTPVQSVVRYAAAKKNHFMWAWESSPHSVASGILDDECYDWFSIVCTMLRTGGIALVANESLLIEANRLAKEKTGINVSATGSAGLAGLMLLSQDGIIRSHENSCVFFTGLQR